VRFLDRARAGAHLADWFDAWPETPQLTDPLVLALPRGGVPVAAEVAKVLAAPLDVLVAQKIGVPGHPETGIAAIAGEDAPVYDRESMALLHLTEDQLAQEVAHERGELHRREDIYRGHHRTPLDGAGRPVVVGDDGLATGITARAALRHLRRQGPARLILAVPVSSPPVASSMLDEADTVVALHQPDHFRSVGQFYEDFTQVSDEEVVGVLREFHALA
jgi:predicted phosphoribosyltransferase